MEEKMSTVALAWLGLEGRPFGVVVLDRDYHALTLEQARKAIEAQHSDIVSFRFTRDGIPLTREQEPLLPFEEPVVLIEEQVQTEAPESLVAALNKIELQRNESLLTASFL